MARTITDERRALLQAVELLDTLNEWFSQRHYNEPTTNKEEVLFESTFHRLNLIDQLVPDLRTSLREVN